MRSTWFDAMTPVQAAIFTIVVSALVYVFLVFVIHWQTNVYLWSGMTVAVTILTVRRALLERRRQETLEQTDPD